ncbi:MAG: DUF3108 domain-containing protein [Bacteroidetes bacterium]|nr:MAG: DUF3108 domain-containing protein [Bacteroidota bacterium]
MKYTHSLYIILFLNIGVQVESLKAQCTPAVWSFKAGEELYYDVVYNWSFIWIEAGKVNFKAKKEYLGNKKVFHFSGTGVSLTKYDWFFKVRDYYHSWANISDLKPIKYTRSTSEGKQTTDNKYHFDYKKNKIYTDSKNSNKNRKLDTLKLSSCLFDIMTAVYYVRTLDLAKYKVNEKIPLKMIVDNEIYNLHGRYLGKETLKTRDKKTYKTLKFSIMLVEGTMFKGGEDLMVWISDDNSRVPLLVEAKILVGSVKASFDYAKNLKYPLHFENTK